MSGVSHDVRYLHCIIMSHVFNALIILIKVNKLGVPPVIQLSENLYYADGNFFFSTRCHRFFASLSNF